MGADDSHFHKITWLFTDGTGTNHLVSLGVFKDLAPGHGRKEIASAPVGHVKIAAKNLTYLVAKSKINKLLVNSEGYVPSTRSKVLVDKLATCSKKEKGQLAPKRKIIFDDTQKTSQRKILGKKADKAAADDKKAADDKTAADDQTAVDDEPAADDKTAADEKNR